MAKKVKITIAADTSNYTTSTAAADENGNIIAQARRLLKVKEGERGLRQSDALFQHIVNMPEMMSQLMKQVREDAAARGVEYEICAVAASTRPRPVEGSYMPVFLAGKGAAQNIAAALDIPFYEFSHQEGHIAAVCGADDPDREFLSFHLSGGTGEILRVRDCMPLAIVGGIRDLSFGQLLDRVGVAAGLQFPAGAELDRIACAHKKDVCIKFSSRGKLMIEDALLKPVHIDGSYADISGIETQALKAVKNGALLDRLAPELFYHISEALYRMVSAAADSEHLDTVVFAGGVSASSFIRQELEKRLPEHGINVFFGERELSSDNACGIGILGMRAFLNS